VTWRTSDPAVFITTTSAAPSGPVPAVRALSIRVPSGEKEAESYW